MTAARKYRRAKWTEAEVQAAIEAMRREIEESFGPKDFDQILQSLQEKAARLGDANDPQQQLALFVTVLALLVWNIRAGGHRQVNHDRYLELAENLLRLNEVPQHGYKLSYLFGYLRNLNGQFAKLSGDHWRALWETALAERADRDLQVQKAYERLTWGNRAFRLGQLDEARQAYEFSVSQAGDSDMKMRARIEMVRLERLRINFLSAKELLSQALNSSPNAEQLAELQFEEKLIDAASRSEIRPLLRTIKKGAPHYHASYVLEAALWAHAAREDDLRQEAYSVGSMQRIPELRPHGHKVLYDCAVAIVEMMDKDIPVETRIDRLGSAIAQTQRLSTIDKELLVMAAAGRVLARNRAHDLARICLKEYESRCLKITAGRSRDCFGLISDLYSSSWFSIKSES
jgi:hypothetical protein